MASHQKPDLPTKPQETYTNQKQGIKSKQPDRQEAGAAGTSTAGLLGAAGGASIGAGRAWEFNGEAVVASAIEVDVASGQRYGSSEASGAGVEVSEATVSVAVAAAGAGGGGGSEGPSPASSSYSSSSVA